MDTEICDGSMCSRSHDIFRSTILFPRVSTISLSLSNTHPVMCGEYPRFLNLRFDVKIDPLLLGLFCVHPVHCHPAGVIPHAKIFAAPQQDLGRAKYAAQVEESPAVVQNQGNGVMWLLVWEFPSQLCLNFVLNA